MKPPKHTRHRCKADPIEGQKQETVTILVNIKVPEPDVIKCDLKTFKERFYGLSINRTQLARIEQVKETLVKAALSTVDYPAKIQLIDTMITTMKNFIKIHH